MCIFGVCVVDTDADSHDGIQPQKILSQNQCCKKGKYIEAYFEKQHHFPLLVLFLVGVMGEDTKEATNQLDAALRTKWDREYSVTCVYVQDGLSMNLLWAFILMFCGTQSANSQRARFRHQYWICGEFR